MDITSIYGSRDSVEFLVSQMMRLESRSRDRLLDKMSSLEERKKVLTELHSKLSTLKTRVDRMTDVLTNYLAAKEATSSNSDKFTATASSSAKLGNHSLSVERLAVSDTRVSKQYNTSDSSFTAYTTDQTFTIEVGHPTDSDPNNRVSVQVTVSADVFSQTNEDVLQDIADAINSAMSQAVADETIDSDEVVHASVVNEESGTARLILRSDQTGYTYRMDFGTSTLLDDLEVNSSLQTSGTSGGYVTYVGTSATDSQLNAKFTLDGLVFYRDSNSVSDAIDGLTIKLLDVFSTTETVTVSSDVDAVREEVQSFIDAYNDVIKYLREKAQINSDTHERGPLADDLVYRDMISDLRDIVNSEVSDTLSTNYNKLFQIGIEADNDGYLSIKDLEKFTDALNANPRYVSDLFRSDTGIATQIKDYIDDFVQAGGKISKSKENLKSQIRDLDDRIDFMNDLLAKKEQQLREQFAKLQETMILLQNQQSFYSSFITVM